MSALDGAAENLSAAREKVTEVGGELKARAGGALEAVHGEVGDLQATVADALDSGADAIRQRVGAVRGRTPAVSGGARRRLTSAGEAVAGSLEQSAYWLRENDIGDLGTFLRQQLREHPGRTALVALGLGMVIGRSSKR
jgi:hypothetical protein